MRNGEATLNHLLAPIQDALDDLRTKEIVIQKPGDVGVESGNEWVWRTVDAYDFRRLDAIGVLAGSLLSRRFGPAHPICLTTLPGGQRFTICRPPVTLPGTISVTIRIPSKTINTIRDPDFLDLMSVTETRAASTNPADAELLALYHAKDWPAFFALAVKAHKTIAATGAVGSGKTTLLRRLLQEIPSDERLITLEDTIEFGEIDHLRNRVAMFYGSVGVTAEAAIETSLRMRPSRVAMQELRGVEAFAYLRLLAAGHPGGLTTWHAEEADPWTPLLLMCKQHPAGREIPDDKLEIILRRLVDIVAFCRRDGSVFSVPSVYYRGAQ